MSHNFKYCELREIKSIKDQYLWHSSPEYKKKHKMEEKSLAKIYFILRKKKILFKNNQIHKLPSWNHGYVFLLKKEK